MSEKPEQEVNDLSVRSVAKEITSEILEMDKGFLGTFWWLLKKPSVVIRSYTKERSQRFTKPSRYLLFSIAFALFANWLVHEKLGFPRLGEVANTEFLQFVETYAALLTLLVLPIIAGFSRLYSHGMGVSYIELVVLLAYTQAELNFLSVIFLLPLTLIIPEQIAIISVVNIGLIIYMIWAWSAYLQGPVWRRYLTAVFTLITASAMNGLLLWLFNYFNQFVI